VASEGKAKPAPKKREAKRGTGIILGEYGRAKRSLFKGGCQQQL
jgi:hypothetical protein